MLTSAQFSLKGQQHPVVKLKSSSTQPHHSSHMKPFQQLRPISGIAIPATITTAHEQTSSQCGSTKSIKSSSSSSSSTSSFDFLRISQTSRLKGLSAAGDSEHLDSQTGDSYSDYSSNLFDAIIRNDIDTVSLILTRADSASITSARDAQGNTPLHICMQFFSQDSQRQAQIAALLLSPSYNADPNARNNDDWCPIHLSARKGMLSALRFALAHNIAILQQATTTNHYNSFNKQQHKMQKPQKLFDMTLAGGPDSTTLLHIAASLGHISMLEFLFRLNFDMNSQNRLGQSARQVAIHSQVLHKILIKYERSCLQDDMFDDGEHPQKNRVLQYLSPDLLLFEEPNDQQQQLPQTRIALVGNEQRNVSELKRLISQHIQLSNTFTASHSPLLSTRDPEPEDHHQSQQQQYEFQIFNSTSSNKDNHNSKNSSFMFSAAADTSGVKSQNSARQTDQNIIYPRRLVMGPSPHQTPINSPQLTCAATSFKSSASSSSHFQKSNKHALLLNFNTDESSLDDISIPSPLAMPPKTPINFFNESNVKRETELSDLDCEEICNYSSEQKQQPAVKSQLQSLQQQIVCASQSTTSDMMQNHSRKKADFNVSHLKQQSQFKKIAKQQRVPFSLFLTELPHIFNLIHSLSTYSRLSSNNNYRNNSNMTSFISEHSANTSSFMNSYSHNKHHRSPSPNWMPPPAKSTFNSPSFEEIDEDNRESRSEILRLLTYLHLIHLKFVRLDSIHFICDPMPPNLQIVSDNLDFTAELSSTGCSKQELSRKQSRIIPELMLNALQHFTKLLQHPACFQIDGSQYPSTKAPISPSTSSAQQKPPLTHQSYQNSNQDTTRRQLSQHNLKQPDPDTPQLRIHRPPSMMSNSNSFVEDQANRLLDQQLPRISSDDIFTCLLRLLRFFELAVMKEGKTYLAELLTITGKSIAQCYVAKDSLLVKIQPSFSPFSIFQSHDDPKRHKSSSAAAISNHSSKAKYVEKVVNCDNEIHFSEKTLLDFECIQTHAFLSSSFAFNQQRPSTPIHVTSTRSSASSPQSTSTRPFRCSSALNSRQASQLPQKGEGYVNHNNAIPSNQSKHMMDSSPHLQMQEIPLYSHPRGDCSPAARNYQSIFRSQVTSPQHSRQSSALPSPMKAISSLIQPSVGDIHADIKRSKINEIKGTSDNRIRNISALNSQRNSTHSQSFASLLKEQEGYMIPKSSVQSNIAAQLQACEIMTPQVASFNTSVMATVDNKSPNIMPLQLSKLAVPSRVLRNDSNKFSSTITDANKLASAWLESQNINKQNPAQFATQSRHQSISQVANKQKGDLATENKGDILSNFNQVNFHRGRYYQSEHQQREIRNGEENIDDDDEEDYRNNRESHVSSMQYKPEFIGQSFKR